LLAVLGVLDQTNPDRAPDHAVTAARFASAQKYTAALEDSLGRGCPVFQLPVVPFPESGGLGEMKGYDQLLPYLASRDLRFSSGAMRGTTAADWQLGVDLDHPTRLADDLAQAGFCALEVDSQGFDEASDPRPSLEAALGVPVAQSDDGVYVAYRLPAPAATTPLPDAPVLHPVVVSLDAYEIQHDGASMAQWVGPQVGLRIINLGDASVPVTIAMDVEVAGGKPRDLTVTDEAGTVVVREQLVPGRTSPLRATIEVPPGTTSLKLETSGDPVRQPATGQVVSARVLDLTASTTTPDVRVVSVQDQVRSGTVVQ
jgi:hypothetical protein